ncbi:unnamed protein product, partial [Prorocentrum cordatum]
MSSYVADELHKEASVLKERRKVREEGSTARRGGAGSGAGDSTAGRQSRADKLASENRMPKEKLAAADGKGKGKSGAAAAADGKLYVVFNWQCGRGVPSNFEGYDCQPAKSIAHTEGRVSLPSDAAKCDASELLDGRPRELRHDWRQRLLRGPEQVREPVVPYFEKLRAVNQEFADRDTTALPSAGVWRGLQIPASHNLSLSQVDIEAAFHRVGAPPGLDEMFALPAVPVDALREVLPVVGIGARLEGKVIAAGINGDRIIQDRRAVPDVGEEAGAAVYVDGVAAIGRSPTSVSTTTEQVQHQHLEANNLKCKGVHSDPEEHKFTVLNFDIETGRISASKGRIWKLRLALLEIAERGYCSGDDMLPLLGHYTWAAILRRCLLGVFHGARRFARAAGSRRWRLWPEVATECRVAAALIAFAYLGTKLEVDPAALATDASTGSGNVKGSGFGGFAVTEKTWNPRDVWAAASCMGRWRYRSEAAVGARRHALGAAQNHAHFNAIMNMEGAASPEGDDDMDQSSRALASRRDSREKLPGPNVSPSEVEQATFEDIDPNFLLPLDSWKLEVFGRWQRPEDTMRLEGRALIT